MADRVKDGVFSAMMDVSLVNDVSTPPSWIRLPLKEQRADVQRACTEDFKGRLLQSAFIWAVRNLLSCFLLHCHVCFLSPYEP